MNQNSIIIANMLTFLSTADDCDISFNRDKLERVASIIGYRLQDLNKTKYGEKDE